MAVNISCEYLGDLHVRAVHGPSGHVIVTDAPVDNQGKGEGFSPTDLAATAMATCFLTILGIHARNAARRADRSPRTPHPRRRSLPREAIFPSRHRDRSELEVGVSRRED